MILLDTGVWVQTLRRRGDEHVRDRLKSLMALNQAAWCDVIRLELWHGATKDDDHRLLRAFEQRVPSLPISPEVWERAINNAVIARKGGLQIPIADHLFFACAQVHEVELEHLDQHFDLLAKLVSDN
jgi:predicted nucleic acid-binding protein